MAWRHIRVSCLRAGLALLVLAPLIASAAPAARAQGVAPAPLVLAAREVEPAPPLLPGDLKDESLFVFADLQYRGEGPLYMDVKQFRIVDAHGVAYYAQHYDGIQPMLPTELIPPASMAGWLVFTVPSGATSLALGYELPKSGKSNLPLVVRTLPFTPKLSATWRYALAARPVLRTYLLDEAQAAGYLRLQIGPVRFGGQSSAMPALDHAYLAGVRSTLSRDRAAFDRLAAPVAGARALKAQADRAFASVEATLGDVPAARNPGAWAAWQAAFSAADRALADDYQYWPGSMLG